MLLPWRDCPDLCAETDPRDIDTVPDHDWHSDRGTHAPSNGHAHGYRDVDANIDAQPNLNDLADGLRTTYADPYCDAHGHADAHTLSISYRHALAERDADGDRQAD